MPDPYKPAPLTIGDLRASIPAVALEMATREAIWSACLADSSLFADLPEMDEPDEVRKKIMYRKFGSLVMCFFNSS